MFEQLDDPEPFRPSDRFRAQVIARSRVLRRRRRTVRVAAGCGAAVSLSAAAITAVRPSMGTPTEIVVTGSAGSEPAVPGSSPPDGSPPAPITLHDDSALSNTVVVSYVDPDCAAPGWTPETAFPVGAAATVEVTGIMLIGVDPTSGAGSLLSLPGDLAVEIADTGGTDRLATAFKPANPRVLIDTITAQLGLPVEHYVGVSHCALEDIVDALGGVSVPLGFAVRDTHTGLNVETPGCHTFSGNEALAYVRSRYYEHLDPATDEWVADEGHGTLARQQDFALRAAARLADEVRADPNSAGTLATIRNVVTDSELTPEQIVDALRGTDPSATRRLEMDNRGVVTELAPLAEPTCR